VLEVGRFVQFDWTWEGAIAFRPGLSAESFSDSDPVIPTDEERVYWCGEVVEVDETDRKKGDITNKSACLFHMMRLIS